MLFAPGSFMECLQEWEDLEKDYQQIQVILLFIGYTCTLSSLADESNLL